MRTDTANACEIIDAAIFVGDEFLTEKFRKELREFMISWEKELKVFDEINKEINEEKKEAENG